MVSATRTSASCGLVVLFFFSSRRRHTRCSRDWSSDVCSSDLFTPLGFLRGSTGRLLSEFGIAVAGAVVISGFVALTLTPMLCAKVLRVPRSEEHTSELQSRLHLVCRLLLEKKKSRQVTCLTRCA